MPKFPVDLPKTDALRILRELGFEVVREREHIAFRRNNQDGTVSAMTLPNHRRIKSATLRSALTQSGVTREAFLEAYERHSR